MSVDPDTFRALLGHFASGVTVVTVADPSGRDHGITVTAFASVSLEPPLVLICIERAASVYPMVRAASAFAVNILSARQEPLARRFAATGENRFDGVGFTRGSTGAALLDDTLAYLECHARGAIDGGDHTIFLGEVEAGVIREGPDAPLLYYRGGYAQLDR